MKAETFRNLPTSEARDIVRQHGSRVCVFPINGTRRWFMLEHGHEAGEDWAQAYLDISQSKHISLYQLIFDHGLDMLLTPVFGADLTERGDDYMQVAAEGLARLANHPEFVAFYRRYDVRVGFYGDYRRHFAHTPYADLSDQFDAISAQTRTHRRHRLFFGVFAHDATEQIASLAVAHHARHGEIPNKRQLIELYYGEYVPPVDLFIGFDKFCAFDMPLIATGNEDLYFTVSPSPYLTTTQLRDILFDHLFTRRTEETDYSAMEHEAWNLMRSFYQANYGNTLGVGAKQKRGAYWYPLPQVKLPAGFTPPKERA